MKCPEHLFPIGFCMIIMYYGSSIVLQVDVIIMSKWLDEIMM